MTFIIIQIANSISVSNPCTKILVYQGADCIIYNSGYFLKCQYLYNPEPMNTPAKQLMIIFNIRCIFFFMIDLHYKNIFYIIHFLSVYFKVAKYMRNVYLYTHFISNNKMNWDFQNCSDHLLSVLQKQNIQK